MIRHYTKAEQAAARAAYPDCFLVEVVTAHATCLVSVPDTPENRARTLQHAPCITGDMLDGLSHVSRAGAEHAAGITPPDPKGEN